MAAAGRDDRKRAARPYEEDVTVRDRNQAATGRRLSAIDSVTPEVIATATLVIETNGQGFSEFTREAMRFITNAGAKDGTLLVFVRHTSASLVIQENADPDVCTDLTTALARLAPVDAGWVHDAEGPDDMPAHVKAMLTGVSLQIPVMGGALALGTWQGIYLAEHRARAHRREVVLQFIGSRR
jgi:secondary thiamine-phosphate synthase enzyme